MKCMNCGAELTESAYCPKCGCDVSVQKQAIVLSGLYYNQGLEKAQVRDLSGAIDQLRRSLKFNKLNISARNLLGLVYFETGEVVAALSEWVISKNIQPNNNIASEYIENLQKDANRLDVINQTIKKYNIALENCHNGNEDVAMIQLKKILAQNPKPIKGYHLLALQYIHKAEYEKARKLLKKAIKIDKTNTTTLRFLHEVDERTGTATTLESRFSIWSNRDNEKRFAETDTRLQTVSSDPHAVIQPPAFRETSAGTVVFNLILGILIGAATVWFLFMPARAAAISRSADEKVTKYSSDMAVDTAELQTLNDQIKASEETVATANSQIDAANKKADAYENLAKAVNAANNNSQDTAANALAAVDTSQLSVEAKAVYDKLFAQLKTIMLAQYKAAGVAAFDSQDYTTAIAQLEAAKAIDATDYDILNYLAHSYRLSGDSANADTNFQLIISTFPNTVKATTAKSYLSTNTAQTADASAETAAAAEEAAAAENTASQADTAAQDTGTQDTTEEQDTGNQDTGNQDTGNQDTGNEDTGN